MGRLVGKKKLSRRRSKGRRAGNAGGASGGGEAAHLKSGELHERVGNVEPHRGREPHVEPSETHAQGAAARTGAHAREAAPGCDGRRDRVEACT